MAKNEENYHEKKSFPLYGREMCGESGRVWRIWFRETPPRKANQPVSPLTENQGGLWICDGYFSAGQNSTVLKLTPAKYNEKYEDYESTAEFSLIPESLILCATFEAEISD